MIYLQLADVSAEKCSPAHPHLVHDTSSRSRNIFVQVTLSIILFNARLRNSAW